MTRPPATALSLPRDNTDGAAPGSSDHPTPPAGTTSAHPLRKAITSSFLGNFVEWFDYALYGYLSATIATVFFPEDEGRTALVKTFGLFALSFLIRPVGAVVWGHIGDRLGRKTALSWSILLMSGATTCIALLPGHATIGVAAPVLLLTFRLIQGFSAAGEYAGASTLLTELAPTGKRGLVAAVVPASTASGLLLGSLMAALLTGVLDDAAMESWGWRIPFLIAAPLGLVGLVIRRSLDESAAFTDAVAQAARANEEAGPGKAHRPLREVFREPRALGIAFAAAVLNAIGFYVILSYMPTYLSEELGQDDTDAFIAASVALFAYIFSVLLTGWMSDRIGRRKIMLTASFAFVVAAVPGFLLLDGAGLALVIVIQIIMGMVLALNDGVLPAFLAEQFSTGVRLTGFAVTFNTANAVFGGTAPMIATLLIGWTGLTVAPAFYLMAAALVTFLAVLKAAETHRAALS
ncbi:MFS transporter [Corynebacterium terpenotabidum]|uniref:Putative proline/betaine transporter n=1 Tax=Corynebacterium terpenotabidum Y-11 TaxID=1200352 RepID=S4XFK3_9CORY|nr:MFS transporter [Corynebacterium terpenotabidum]AGP30405.1 major facilitator superfamily permease [Corynebacterium terpenotabidum Y-11]